jgi:hypothetical protein
MSFDRVAFARRVGEAEQAAAKRGEEAFGYEARPDGSISLRTRPKRRNRPTPTPDPSAIAADLGRRVRRGVVPRPPQESLF